MTLFDRIKNLADEQKISITKLQEDLGMSKNYLYKWNKDEANPNMKMLEKVADYFNVSLDYLLGRTDIRYTLKKENLSSINSTSSECTTIAAHVDNDVTEEEMDDIKKYIEFLKSKRH